MIYHLPQDVLSPRDCVDNVRVIFDGQITNDAYSIAEIEFEGVDYIAIRWNVALREWDDPNKINNSRVCVGLPSSRGYPVWFVLPPSFLDPNSAPAKALKEYLNNKKG